ncbi:hypothetical protein [Celerinatantimonas yamalensis]|uniref:Uncharacterized protein n=1 Tax=Celerinatantimonas yamalensis TaxID=559956 RepID=A0ABW9G825_9GAMM
MRYIRGTSSLVQTENAQCSPVAAQRMPGDGGRLPAMTQVLGGFYRLVSPDFTCVTSGGY